MRMECGFEGTKTKFWEMKHYPSECPVIFKSLPHALNKPRAFSWLPRGGTLEPWQSSGGGCAGVGGEAG